MMSLSAIKSSLFSCLVESTTSGQSQAACNRRSFVRYVWLIDKKQSAQHRYINLGDIPRCMQVGIEFQTTSQAFELQASSVLR
jgi:hypothetical protein